jgi:hypothetical protein
MSKVRNHNDRIIEPTERHCIVKCGIHLVANSGAEVVPHLGVTSSYALTEIVAYCGSRSTASTDDQQFVDREIPQMRGPWWGMAKSDNLENAPANW